MNEPTRTEELYMILTDTLNELAELESPEVIFDFIVDNFASEAEYHLGQANTFKGMLDAFRHDNPAETIPHGDLDAVDRVMEDTTANLPTEEEIFGGMSDINKQYLLEDRDNLLNFLKNVHFPDKLDS